MIINSILRNRRCVTWHFNNHRQNNTNMITNDTTLKNKQIVQRRLYRLAKRKGFKLSKCRSRTPSHPDYGTYCICYLDRFSHPHNVAHMAGHNGYGLTLDQVEEYLKTHSAV